MSDDSKQLVSVRLPPSLIDQLDQISEMLEELPEYGAHGSLSRSEVIRLALSHGLDYLRGKLSDRIDNPDQVDLVDHSQE